MNKNRTNENNEIIIEEGTVAKIKFTLKCDCDIMNNDSITYDHDDHGEDDNGIDIDGDGVEDIVDVVGQGNLKLYQFHPNESFLTNELNDILTHSSFKYAPASVSLENLTMEQKLFITNFMDENHTEGLFKLLLISHINSTKIYINRDYLLAVFGVSSFDELDEDDQNLFKIVEGTDFINFIEGANPGHITNIFGTNESENNMGFQIYVLYGNTIEQSYANDDDDDDGDGINNSNDIFPFNPNEHLDTDWDGVGNNADNDDDGDGINDVDDAFPLDPNNGKYDQE